MRCKVLGWILSNWAASSEPSKGSKEESNSVASRDGVRAISDMWGVPPVAELGLYRPIKNIRFINGEGRSAGRRCQSLERSGAGGRGSEHGAVLGYAPRRAAQAGLTGGADWSGRLRRETNVRKEDQPKAVPLNLCQRIWFCLGMFVGMSEVVRARQCVWWEG